MSNTGPEQPTIGKNIFYENIETIPSLNAALSTNLSFSLGDLTPTTTGESIASQILAACIRNVPAKKPILPGTHCPRQENDPPRRPQTFHPPRHFNPRYTHPRNCTINAKSASRTLLHSTTFSAFIYSSGGKGEDPVLEIPPVADPSREGGGGSGEGGS
ncbi:hypothetical protein CEXT_70121 [Caerostris extrusa]|uniref:Uncharacterized protein n=1 Tax=Caerostris extrusa TaxID=172846 RepID=A0AAV4U6S9_CAEEX|nr:hypothetical protein CEXT_70121 [Caerostris extrusa]